jgi:hypothetical protein
MENRQRIRLRAAARRKHEREAIAFWNLHHPSGGAAPDASE